MSKLYFIIFVLSMSFQTNLLYASQTAQDPPELDISIELKLYPNPTVDLINIEITNLKTGTFELRNLIGKQLASGLISQKVTTLNIQDYQDGLYLLSIYDETGGRLITKKVLKK